MQPATRNDAGFTVVELLIALVISLLLIAAAAQLYLSAGASYRLNNTLGELQENGRFALELLRSELRRAGYLGGITDPATIIDFTAGGLASEDGNCQDSRWARSLDRTVFGKDDNRSGYDCLKPLASAAQHIGDILVVRYASAIPVEHGTTAYQAAHPYLRSSPGGGYLFSGSDAAQHPLAGAAVRSAALVARGYYLHDTTISSHCGTVTLPALQRVALVNGRLQNTELVSGVEQLQIRYGIDSDHDAAVDRYIDAPPASDQNRWGQVIAVRIWLLLRSACVEQQHVDTHDYRMGNLHYTPQDGYRRLLLTTTVRLRNPQPLRF